MLPLHTGMTCSVEWNTMGRPSDERHNECRDRDSVSVISCRSIGIVSRVSAQLQLMGLVITPTSRLDNPLRRCRCLYVSGTTENTFNPASYRR